MDQRTVVGSIKFNSAEITEEAQINCEFRVYKNISNKVLVSTKYFIIDVIDPTFCTQGYTEGVLTPAISGPFYINKGPYVITFTGHNDGDC